MRHRNTRKKMNNLKKIWNCYFMNWEINSTNILLGAVCLVAFTFAIVFMTLFTSATYNEKNISLITLYIVLSLVCLWTWFCFVKELKGFILVHNILFTVFSLVDIFFNSDLKKISNYLLTISIIMYLSGTLYFCCKHISRKKTKMTVGIT